MRAALGDELRRRVALGDERRADGGGLRVDLRELALDARGFRVGGCERIVRRERGARALGVPLECTCAFARSAEAFPFQVGDEFLRERISGSVASADRQSRSLVVLTRARLRVRGREQRCAPAMELTRSDRRARASRLCSGVRPADARRHGRWA